MQGIMFQEDLFLKVVTGHKVETRRTGGLIHVNSESEIASKARQKYPGIRPDEAPQRWDDMSKYPNEYIAEEYKKKKGTYFVFSGSWGGAIVRPRYHPGEILYLKEPVGRINGHLFRAYDYPPTSKMRTEFKGWGNKMFMRADDARHFIRITDVRCERAWEITEEGAIREGVANRAEFEKKWAEINGISSWKPNPYVFVYGFEYLPNYKIC
jgi:hypothetical protein